MKPIYIVFFYILFFIFYTTKSKAQCPLVVDTAIFISPGMSGFTGSLDPEDRFGNSVEVIGDVNKDGIDDLVVGASNDDDGGVNAGAVWILFMNSNGSVQNQQKISLLSGGFSGNVGDIFGTEVESIGDFDKDGIPDIAVYSRQVSTSFGTVFLLFLNIDGTVKSMKEISGTQGNWTPNLMAGGNLGYSIQNMGDLDKDGTIDLALGAPYEDDGGFNFGSIYIVFLKPDASVKSFQKISKSQGGYTGPFSDDDIFGLSLANVGDLDKDGITDLATGIYGDDGGTNKGAVIILFLNSNGTVKTFQRISNTSGDFTGTLDVSDFFGYELKSVGDTNFDGYPELLVAAPNDDDGGTDVGAIWVLSLNTNGTVHHFHKLSSTTGHTKDLQLNSGDLFGVGLSMFSDLNKDTYPELVVGVSQKDFGGTDVGAIYLLSLIDTCCSYAVISPGDTSICVNSDLEIINRSVGSNTSAKWFINNVVAGPSTNLLFKPSISGNYTIKLEVTKNSCVTKDSVIVSAIDYPVVTLNNKDTTIFIGQTVTLNGCCGSNYVWSPTIYLNNPNSITPVATPEKDVQYTLTVTNGGLCSVSKTVSIEVKYELFVPQLFSPNGDMTNDAFKVYGSGIKQLELSIYNNWGQRVYTSSDINDIVSNGWDGKYNGADQPTGSYVWNLEGSFINGSPMEFNGKKSGSFLLTR